jgi:hypothetical protein
MPTLVEISGSFVIHFRVAGLRNLHGMVIENRCDPVPGGD